MLDQDLQPRSAGGAVAPPRPFKSANNRSRARGLLRPRNQLYEHTTGHERAFLAAERRGCVSVEGSQGLSRFQAGKPGPGDFLDCSSTPLEVGNLGSLRPAKGFGMNTAPSHPRGVSQEAAGTTGSEIDRERADQGTSNASSPLLKHQGKSRPLSLPQNSGGHRIPAPKGPRYSR